MIKLQELRDNFGKLKIDEFEMRARTLIDELECNNDGILNLQELIDEFENRSDSNFNFYEKYRDFKRWEEQVHI